MVFQVYAGNAGSLGGAGWHADCEAVGTAMAVDIFANEGATVQFSIVNNGIVPLTYRYCVDCTDFKTGTPSSVMVQVSSSAGTYMFRYAHLDVSSAVPSRASGWSASRTVQPGASGQQVLGTLSEVSVHYDDDGNAIPGWANGSCGQSDGDTDIGGLCSSDPHLHQGASNGSWNGCLSADDDGTAFSRHMVRPCEAVFPAT